MEHRFSTLIGIPLTGAVVYFASTYLHKMPLWGVAVRRCKSRSICLLSGTPLVAGAAVLVSAGGATAQSAGTVHRAARRT